MEKTNVKEFYLIINQMTQIRLVGTQWVLNTDSLDQKVTHLTNDFGQKDQ